MMTLSRWILSLILQSEHSQTDWITYPSNFEWFRSIFFHKCMQQLSDDLDKANPLLLTALCELPKWTQDKVDVVQKLTVQDHYTVLLVTLEVKLNVQES